MDEEILLSSLTDKEIISLNEVLKDILDNEEEDSNDRD